jgi:dCTP deaminase
MPKLERAVHWPNTEATVKNGNGGIHMVLSDGEIIGLLEEGSLCIEPLEQEQIQPASVDIRLGNTFCVLEDTPGGIIRLSDDVKYKMITTDKYLLLPGQFVLATTVEYFKMPDNLTAFVEGRSSLGRLGLFIQNAGWVDPGFQGEITLELFNANRCAIELESGHRIGQLVFARMEKNALHPYEGKYQRQRGATGSRVFMDFLQGDGLH